MLKNIRVLASFLCNSLDGFDINQRWLENIFAPIISSGLQAEILPMEKEILREMFDLIYQEYNIKPGKNSWIDIQTKEPTQRILDIFLKYFKDSLVITFELHPLIQKSFDKLGFIFKF